MLHNIKLPLDIHTTITYMYTSPTVHLCAADRELTISYCRSTLVSWWNTRFAFIESQNCPWAHCSLVLTPESWMTSLGYFYTWRVNSFIDCRTMRHFPMIHDNDLIVALFLKTGKWLGYNESTVGRLQRQLDCLVSWWWLISGHQLKVHNSLIPDGWMDGWVCYSWSWLLDHEYYQHSQLHHPGPTSCSLSNRDRHISTGVTRVTGTALWSCCDHRQPLGHLSLLRTGLIYLCQWRRQKERNLSLFFLI